jgi:hypothetical protein
MKQLFDFGLRYLLRSNGLTDCIQSKLVIILGHIGTECPFSASRG